MEVPDDCRILSIQSHVVRGYVGNRSAVLPLQILGFDVDYINSVQFSNHTWYKVFQGQVLDDKDLTTLYEGLKVNDLHRYDYILTGYIGSESFLLKVREIVTELKSVNPNIKYVCDPVMGDDGVMYVPEGLLPLYREEILPLADVVLPNQWEAQQLSGLPLNSESEALAAMQWLHDHGPKTVVLSSTNLGVQEVLTGFASTITDGKRTCIRMEIPRLSAMFIGTGDLFAALWLAWSHKHGDNLELIANKVQSTMQHVLHRTLIYAKGKTKEGDKPSWENLELRLVQSKKDIEEPKLVAKVETMAL